MALKTFTINDGSANQALVTNGSGVLSFAAVGASAGQVIQVVSSDENTAFSTSSTTFVNSNIEVSITPSSASNKIFIIATVNGSTANSSSAWVGTIFRNSTNLASGSGVLQESFSHLHVNTAGDLQIGTSLSFLDSPSTTSSTTYSIRIASPTGNSISVNGNSQHSTITVFEIKG